MKCQCPGKDVARCILQFVCDKKVLENLDMAPTIQ